MRAKIETKLPCSIQTMREEIAKPESLQFVSAPILKFVPVENEAMAYHWKEGASYKLKLFLFNIIPLGAHCISIKSIDLSANRLYTNETGFLVKVWNHEIRFHELDEQYIYYVDDIEIKAGFLTLPIWLFAQVFYRHRQRRWRVLLKMVG